MRSRRANLVCRTKIKTLTELRRIILSLKKQGKRIVFTNGCFDLLHYGHVKYLEGAKNKGDILIVGINRDSSVRKIKGMPRPLVNQKDRSRIIAALAAVDYVTLFKEDTPLKLIKSIKPEILVKGSDWRKDEIVGADFVLSYGGRILTISLAGGRSTTNLIKKIAKAY